MHIFSVFVFFFFFSSRRRHTRCSRDWSSDVCSSDLLRRRSGPGSDRCAARAGRRAASRPARDRLRLSALAWGRKIGRASCRERVEISVGAGALKKKKKKKKKSLGINVQ